MNKTSKKRGRGRPALPKKHVRGSITPIRLKDEERKAFTKAAKAKNVTLSEWLREAGRTLSGMNAPQPASRTENKGDAHPT